MGKISHMTERFGYHASLYNQNFTKAENESFTQQFGELTQEFAKAMSEGLAPESDHVQSLVKRHFEFCLRFWTPTREAYKSLAMSYILPSPYRDSYESVANGLGQYHYEALIHWADENLAE